MMQKQPEWVYDESRHCGVDYADAETVAAYDQRHGNFRDFKAEAAQVKALLGLSKRDRVIDLGAGTGGLTVHLAQAVEWIWAVDVSESMLARCRQKCEQAGLTNVTCCKGGFLSYVHEGPAVDAVISQAALHHLPDMWKQTALLRIFDLLKPGGQFLLVDVVFPFAPRDWQSAVSDWLAVHVPQVGSEAITHIKDEYSTFDWIITGMLERAGFIIDRIQDRGGFIAAYVCRKPAC